jgi:hypothetical protein
LPHEDGRANVTSIPPCRSILEGRGKPFLPRVHRGNGQTYVSITRSVILSSMLQGSMVLG